MFPFLIPFKPTPYHIHSSANWLVKYMNLHWWDLHALRRQPIWINNERATYFRAIVGPAARPIAMDLASGTRCAHIRSMFMKIAKIMVVYVLICAARPHEARIARHHSQHRRNRCAPRMCGRHRLVEHANWTTKRTDETMSWHSSCAAAAAANKHQLETHVSVVLTGEHTDASACRFGFNL